MVYVLLLSRLERSFYFVADLLAIPPPSNKDLLSKRQENFITKFQQELSSIKQINIFDFIQKARQKTQ